MQNVGTFLSIFLIHTVSLTLQIVTLSPTIVKYIQTFLEKLQCVEDLRRLSDTGDLKEGISGGSKEEHGGCTCSTIIRYYFLMIP